MQPVLTDLLPAELTELYAPLGISAGESRRIYAHHVQHDRQNWAIRDLARDKCARAAAAVRVPELEVVERHRSLIDGCYLEFPDIRAVSQQLAAMTCEERTANPCIGADRADLVVAGCAILEAICGL